MNTSRTDTTSEEPILLEQTVLTIRGILEELHVPATLHEPLFEGTNGNT